MQFVADLEPTEDGSLQIMYGIDGRRDLTESTLRRPLRLRGRAPGADRQRRVRPAPERRLRRRARLDPAAHATAASGCRAGSGRSCRAQAECATQVWQQAGPGHLGGARRAAALRLVEADVLGRARPGGASWRRSAATRSSRPTWRGDGRGDPRRHPRPRRQRAAACCASTTTPTPSTRRRLLAAIFGFLPGDDERLQATVIAIADELTEDGFVLRYQHRRDRRRPLGQGGDLPHLLLLARLGPGNRRRAAAGARPDGAAAAHRLAARPLRRGVRRRRPGGTSATSRRRSRTWR